VQGFTVFIEYWTLVAVFVCERESVYIYTTTSVFIVAIVYVVVCDLPYCMCRDWIPVMYAIAPIWRGSEWMEKGFGDCVLY
jgi:hypothetical protein